ncbi:MAG: RnfABCDGE type electron transport complex subunit D [Bacteroidales bacterium]
MSNLLTVSASPHVHTSDSTKKIMYGVLLSLVPAFLVSVYAFGVGAILVTLVAVISCVAVEYAIQKFLLKGSLSILDGSAAITGVLLAFNLPSNIPLWMVIIGSIVAIGVGKMSFGGLGNNPFNPALVGRVFLLISFPVQMTSWPLPFVNNLKFVDATTGATPLAILKEGVKSGSPITDILPKLPSNFDLFLGNINGCIGEISAVALLLGAGYLLYKKIITWHIPVAVLGSMFIFSGILWLINPAIYMSPMFHILTGGAMLGALYMATDMVTSPMTYKGMIIFGIGIGILTILIRVFGAYPEGMSFAILLMNATVPLLNKFLKPQRFGTKNNK